MITSQSFDWLFLACFKFNLIKSFKYLLLGFWGLGVLGVWGWVFGGLGFGVAGQLRLTPLGLRFWVLGFGFRV